MKRPKIALVLTTLNEIEGMKVIFPQIDLKLFSQVLVLDGNSSDGTIEYCRSKNLDILIQSKRGFRNGMYEMCNVLAEENLDYIVTFSPDGNCDPATLEKFTASCDGNSELIIGSRYKDGATSDDDDFLTAAGNLFFTKLTNILFRTRLTDVFSIYRGFKPELIKKLCLEDEKSFAPIEKVFRTRIGWEPLMTFRAARMNVRIREVSVGEPARIGGQRKLQIFRWGGAFLCQLLRETWYRPEKGVSHETG
jgi:glycosyltransferase involved in cell wall biosynthesis